ncbi:MAG: InlB B-repeat-containing protein, partial [Candidatus Lindowbacteria bacterium]|nr:InlB B-repeat-containing protein [Candidatus Lindowbacteria bacterium]
MNLKQEFGRRSHLWLGLLLVAVLLALFSNTGHAQFMGAWITTKTMVQGKYAHTATLLGNGKVLVAGGYDGSVCFSSCELYSTTTGEWTPTNSLPSVRSYHTATLLPNGKVLVAGGSDGSSFYSSCELYDPTAGTWSVTGAMTVGRYCHTATLLPNGKVLVTGGKGGSNSFASCDLYAPSLCALAYSTSGNGTLYGVTPQVVPIGGDASAVLAIPHNGYHFINWTGLNGFVTNTENPLIVTNVQSGMTLTANFALNTYTLSMEVYPNGSGTTNPVTGTATHGVPTAISAIPASGYHFVNWFNTATVTVANTSLASTTATLSDDAIVIASFSPNILTMAVSPVGSGSTSPSIGTVSQAGSVAITATPAAFYHFVNWTTTANASLVDSNSVSTTATITGDATVTANFALDTYVMTLAVSPTNSGTTSPVSTGAGTHGVPTAISATPSTGYHFVNWTTTANAAVADAANASTTATLVGVATVTANFTLNTYTLSMAVSLADKGSTIPASTGAATHGIATSISATPATGYHFTSWTATANATLVSLNSPSTTATLIGDATVTANFAINSYTVNFLAGANGIVTGVASQVVNHGANCSGVLAVAAAHYHFVNWTGTNDFLTTTTNPLTVSNVPETMTITANFAIDSFPVTFAVGTNGTLSGTAVQAINYGDSTTAVTAVPAAGYHFTGWTGDHTGMDNPLTITNVTASKAITAIFVINQYSVVFQAGAN